MSQDNHLNHVFIARHVLARRIRLLRSLRRWSQEVLAELAGLDRTYIGAIEREERNPGLDNIEKIANAFEVPVRSLLDERFENLFDSDIDGVKEPRPVYGSFGDFAEVNYPRGSYQQAG